MQATGQYGVSDVPQYAMGRVAPPHGHIFNISQERSLSPSSAHSHTHSHSQQNHQHNRSLHSQPPLIHQQLHLTDQPQQHPCYAEQPHKQHPRLSAQPAAQRVQQHVQSSHDEQMVSQPPGFGSDSLPQVAAASASVIASRPNPSKPPVTATDEPINEDEQDGLGEEAEGVTIGSRWPRQETLALLKIRSDMDAAFRDSNLKGPLWEEISRRLADMGYHRNAKKCKEKFENVNKYYKRTKDQGGKAGRQDGKSYRFFSQLEALYEKSGEGRNISSTNSGLLRPTSVAPKSPGALTEAATNLGRKVSTTLNPESDVSSGMKFSSDTSDDDFEDHPDGKKRKRKSVKKYLVLFEKLMKKVIDKQEQLQQKFLEAMERRDQDRMIREEAWKRQEMARLNREQDLRAQEHAISASRDAALVAFLQKMMGDQPLQLPQIASEPHYSASMGVVCEDFEDPSNRRWPKREVIALITLRIGLEKKFHEPGSKALLWEQISSAMACQGYNRTPKRCKEKWENMNKYFKKAKESHKERPLNAKTCPYFHCLDSLYKEGVLGGSHSKQLLLENAEGQSEGLLEIPSGSNSREDSGQAEKVDSEILAIMPAGKDGHKLLGGMAISNEAAAQLMLDSETGINKQVTNDLGSSLTASATTATLSLSS